MQEINENIDQKLLNIIINSQKELGDFASVVSEGVFEPQYRKFAKSLITFYKTYNSCTNLDLLIEFSKSRKDIPPEYITDMWNKTSELKTDPREYNFILKKINTRYNINIIKQFAERAAGVSNENVEIINDSVLKISSEIQNIGAKKTYKEILLKNYISEWKQSFFARAKNKELAQGIMTSFSMIDYYTNGFRKGEFGLIAGDTGTGKSIFLLNLATNCFMGKNPLPTNDNDLADLVDNKKWDKAYNVLYISLEMPADEVADRILSIMASVNNLDISKGSIYADDANRIKRALYYWENSPYNIKIVDMPRGCSMAAIQAIYDETCLEFKPDIVIIDYLGLMTENDAISDADWEKLKNVSEQMHEFARINQTVVFSAVQVTSAKPGEGGIGLHRIGRSKMIAHNANIVFQIENREDEDMRSDARIHCIKFRRGPKFIMTNLRKEFQYTRFVDLGFTPDKERKEGSGLVQSNDDLTSLIEQIFGQEEIAA